MTTANQNIGIVPVWDLQDRLVKARRARGLSQVDLAGQLGISIRTRCVVCINMHDLLTSAQVAERLKITRTEVNRRAADGRLPARKLPGRTGSYIFDQADIERIEAESEAASA